MTKRPDGELEQDVLRALWEIDAPVSPSEVIDHLHSDLAYTSIATVLGRLCDKDLAERRRDGRSFRYTAARSEADVAASRICSILDTALDRESALAGFARALDRDEAEHLADLLRRTE
ncbi:MAG: BlaI/MecI/CopY family transcriptional regulator [Actinomycetota bacterium]